MAVISELEAQKHDAQRKEKEAEDVISSRGLLLLFPRTLGQFPAPRQAALSRQLQGI